MTPMNDKCICSQRSNFDKCVWYYCGFIYIKVHFKLNNSRSNDMQFAFSNYGSIKNKESYTKVHLYIQFSLCFCKPESCTLKNCMIPYPPPPTQSMFYPLTPTHVQKHVKYSVVLKV